jgi:inositol-phosphate phosphatase/L-galactose 1-phosphate phosphatase/histidinol-phosphatase
MASKSRVSRGAHATCPARFIAFAGRLADAAAVIARRYFRKGVEVIGKADESPVTVADRTAEKRMRAMITREFPAHGIFGEEHGNERIDAEYVWVLDPIDGTKAFISGVPLFGTLIALLHHGRPILGVIEQPALRERWVGASGRPTRFCGKPATTRNGRDLAAATLFATTPHMFSDKDATAFERLRLAVKLPRYGADCFAYGLLASGHVDIVVESNLKPYDYLALVPVIEGAGGVITDWSGAALGLGSDGHVCAAGSRKLHAAALAILNQ